MSELKIVTNGHRRELLCWEDLTPGERKELDYISYPEDRGTDFFHYKGQVYDLNEFEIAKHVFPGWDGYRGDSFFSGVLVRYPREGGIDTDHVVVGWYYC